MAAIFDHLVTHALARQIREHPAGVERSTIDEAQSAERLAAHVGQQAR